MAKNVVAKNKRVILVSGMSGAGKSTATRFLEDMGYHVIDNFPVQLVTLLVDMIETSTDPRYSYLALSTTAQDFAAFLRGLKGQNIEVQVLFLEASDSVLLHRYKSTRRMHPLLLINTANTLEEAIAVERQMFARNINNSFITIDTSFLSEKEFRRKIEQYFSKSSVPTFSLSFVSFGYKFGVPMDADLMVDVRFLPNPFWVVALRPFSGNDKAHSMFFLGSRYRWPPLAIPFPGSRIRLACLRPLDNKVTLELSKGQQHIGNQTTSRRIVNQPHVQHMDIYASFQKPCYHLAPFCCRPGQPI